MFDFHENSFVGISIKSITLCKILDEIDVGNKCIATGKHLYKINKFKFGYFPLETTKNK